MLPLIAALSPNAAILLLTAGFALIAVELNRPGSILPGVLGLLIALFSVASLLLHHPSVGAAVEAALLLGLITAAAWRSPEWLYRSIAILATLALIHSLRLLIPVARGDAISDWAAVVSGLALGIGTSLLTRIARRARQNKGLD